MNVQQIAAFTNSEMKQNDGDGSSKECLKYSKTHRNTVNGHGEDSSIAN